MHFVFYANSIFSQHSCSFHDLVVVEQTVLFFLALYSTVTDFARFLGLSMSQPFNSAA